MTRSELLAALAKRAGEGNLFFGSSGTRRVEPAVLTYDEATAGELAAFQAEFGGTVSTIPPPSPDAGRVQWKVYEKPALTLTEDILPLLPKAKRFWALKILGKA